MRLCRLSRTPSSSRLRGAKSRTRPARPLQKESAETPVPLSASPSMNPWRTGAIWRLLVWTRFIVPAFMASDRGRSLEHRSQKRRPLCPKRAQGRGAPDEAGQIPVGGASLHHGDPYDRAFRMCDPCQGLDGAGILIDLIVAFRQSLAKAT